MNWIELNYIHKQNYYVNLPVLHVWNFSDIGRTEASYRQFDDVDQETSCKTSWTKVMSRHLHTRFPCEHRPEIWHEQIHADIEKTSIVHRSRWKQNNQWSMMLVNKTITYSCNLSWLVNLISLALNKQYRSTIPHFWQLVSW